MIKSENTTLSAILSLLPGLLALSVIGLIVDISDINEFRLILYGLVLTLVCWAVAWPLVWIWTKITKRTVVWDQTRPAFLSGMAALSLVVGVVIGIAIQNDVFYLIARSIRGT